MDNLAIEQAAIDEELEIIINRLRHLRDVDKNIKMRYNRTISTLMEARTLYHYNVIVRIDIDDSDKNKVSNSSILEISQGNSKEKAWLVSKIPEMSPRNV